MALKTVVKIFKRLFRVHLLELERKIDARIILPSCLGS